MLKEKLSEVREGLRIGKEIINASTVKGRGIRLSRGRVQLVLCMAASSIQLLPLNLDQVIPVVVTAAVPALRSSLRD